MIPDKTIGHLHILLYGMDEIIYPIEAYVTQNNTPEIRFYAVGTIYHDDSLFDLCENLTNDVVSTYPTHHLDELYTRFEPE